MSLPRRLLLVGAEVDLERRMVERQGSTVRLSPTEARLLGWLASRPGAVSSEETLLQEVWSVTPGSPAPLGLHPRTVPTAIERLRSKIEVDPAKPDHVLAVEGGYTFVFPKSVAPSEPLEGPEERLGRAMALLERNPPLLTLAGPQGAGRSFLARQVASRWEERGGQVVMVELEGVDTPALVLARVASALGLRLQPSGGHAELGRALIVRAPLLLVLDDLDLPLDNTSLEPVLGLEGVSVLATAQKPTALAGERVLSVEPLSEVDTRRLLLRLTREMGAREELLTEAVLAPIGEATAGLPLAIVLAASWLALLRPATLASRMAALLSTPPESRGLRGCLARAFEVLEEGDALALRVLCAVPGPLPQPAFEEVTRTGSTDRPLERLQRLIQRAWVSLDAASRVRVHASIRALVSAGTQAGLARTAHKRLLAWAGRLLRQKLAQLEGPEHADALAQLERELPMLWALWARTEPGPQRARLACDLASIELSGSLGPQTLLRLEEAVLEAGDDRLLGVMIRCRRTQVLQKAGQPAREAAQEALQWAERSEQPALAVEARILHGIELRRVGALDEAARELQRAAEQANASPGPGAMARLKAMAELERAAVDCAVSAWQSALPRLREVEAAAKALGNRHLEMLAAVSLASAERQTGLASESEASMRRALALAEELGALENAAYLRSNLAHLCTFDGRAAEAVHLLEQAHAWYRRHGQLRSEALALYGLAFALLALGKPSMASRLVVRAAAAFRATSCSLEEGYALGLLARLEHHAGRPSEALRRYDEALALLVGTGTVHAQFQALAAMAAEDLGHRARALELRQAAASALGGGPAARELLALVDRALGARERPDSERVWAELRGRLASVDLDRLLG